MARPRLRQPEPGRWPPCARCGDCYEPTARWPEGPICNYCYNKAKNRRGTCATCPHQGVLPGLDTAGTPTCRTCAGISITLDCRRCGTEDVLYRAGTCQRCAFTDDLTALLTGPDGTIAPGLVQLRDALAGMPEPRSGIAWLRMGPKVPALLRSLGSGEVSLTHEALDTLPANRTVDYLRGLLVEHEVLPPRDARLARYTSWLDDRLAGITDQDTRQLIERFGRWHHLRRLRDQARQGEVSENAFLRAKQSTTAAINFLGWLTDRGRTLNDCSQHDIDAWFAGGTSTRHLVDVFLYWARNQRLLPRIDVPRRSSDSHPELGAQDRLDLLRKILLHDTLSLPYRVAAGLLLLFGQPAHRSPAGRPDPLQRRQRPDHPRRRRPGHSRTVRRAATLPSRRPAEPRHRRPPRLPLAVPRRHPRPPPLHRQPRPSPTRAGVPVLAARTATWTDLVRDAPPQVLARALGISPTTAMRHAGRAGADWTAYAGHRSGR